MLERDMREAVDGSRDNTSGLAGNAVSAKPDLRVLAILTVGFGCLVAFSRMLSLGFVGYFDDGVYSSTDSWYLLRTAVTIVMLVVLAIAGRYRLFSLGGKTLAAATALAVGATMVFAVDAAGTYGPVVAVVAGASSAVLLYVWFMLLASYSVRTIVQVTVASLPVSWAIVSGAPLLDSALALVIAVASAFVAGAAAFTLDSDLKCCESDGVLSASESLRIPWLTVITVIVCGLYSMILYAVADELTWLYNWSANLIAFAIGALGVVVGTAAIMLRSPGWMHTAWLPMFALLAFAIVLSCLPMRETIQIAAGLILAAVFCAHFLYWMVFPAMLSALRVPRAFFAGIVLVLSNGSLASSIGNAFAAMLPRSMQSLGSVAGMMAIVFAGMFAVTFVLNRKAFGAVGMRSTRVDSEVQVVSAGESPSEAEPESANASEGNAGGALHQVNEEPSDAMGASALPDQAEKPGSAAGIEPNPVDVLKVRLEAVTAEYGLTPRESEIAFYTVQGFSCAYIADKLVVSNSTVRFHQQNLYRKLDVHSRNELIEFVNGAPGKPVAASS